MRAAGGPDHGERKGFRVGMMELGPGATNGAANSKKTGEEVEVRKGVAGKTELLPFFGNFQSGVKGRFE